MNPKLTQAVELVVNRPRLPLWYMALILKIDQGELELLLLIAANQGWLAEVKEGCCKQGSLFEATTKGLEWCPFTEVGNTMENLGDQ